MLRIDRHNKSVRLLERRSLADADLRERVDVQQMIRTTPEAFFAEMNETLLLIGEELRPVDFVDDRIDLLAIDQQGAAVVIEIKRGSHKLHLLQALSYAGMISKWEPDRFTGERSQLTTKSHSDSEQEIEDFLAGDLSSVNQQQRVILLAEDFDYEVLVRAEWLTETYNVDIRCYRLTLSTNEEHEFLACTCIFPPPEITQHAIRRKDYPTDRSPRWADWDSALADIENQSVRDFFRQELEAGRSANLDRRFIAVPVGGRKLFRVSARRNRAYVWQSGRFRDDVEFWKQELGEQADVSEMAEGRRLRFFLKAPEDFATFREAVQRKLLKIDFMHGKEASADDPEG